MQHLKKPFNWQGWKKEDLPRLEAHSAAKLNVLRDYVEEYIAILCARSFGVERFRLTVVDGFSGGGIYEGNEMGSPLVLIKAVETAEARLNHFGRVKQINVECDFHFVDEKKSSVDCLRHQLETSGYKERMDKSIFLHCGPFDTKYSTIVDHIKKRHAKGGARVIFFLDQCGYSQINPKVLNQISQDLGNKVEFIINFAIKWLEEYIGDNKTFRTVFSKLGLDEIVTADKLIELKNQNRGDWKYFVESQIGPAYKAASGMEFFSPFYIEPADRHRGYWLLHLAPHERARAAMLDVHWRHANSHRHFGNAGLDMLAFKADSNPTGYFDGMSFNDLTRETAKVRLSEDFARAIRNSHADGISFNELRDTYANRTIANGKLMQEIISDLATQSEVTVSGPKGCPKRGQKINGGDLIFPCSQLMLFSQKIKK
jgi:three-Cys-motif partner protein